MKKFIFAALAALGLMTATLEVGCVTKPTVDEVSVFSTLIGTTAGSGVLISKPEPKVQNTIRGVVVVAEAVTPASNETFVVRWTPVAEYFIDEAIKAGKLDKDLKPLVMSGVSVVCNGIDFIFIKHPEWKQDEDLVKAAIHGFCSGFLAIVPEVPEDGCTDCKLQAPKSATIDIECFNYLMQKQK